VRPTRGTGIIGAAGKGFEVFVLVREAIDAPKEIARLKKDREKAESEVSRTQAKLANSSFVERAPKEVVDREKEKLEELARLIGKIDGYVRALQG
ncbi:MAG TPA: valine--tRNA ligase, partial [Spirochaetia bacterium]|nr:valine--tRNA ligase [Spirochaetia bacterium]